MKLYWLARRSFRPLTGFLCFQWYDDKFERINCRFTFRPLTGFLCFQLILIFLIILKWTFSSPNGVSLFSILSLESLMDSGLFVRFTAQIQFLVFLPFSATSNPPQSLILSLTAQNTYFTTSICASPMSYNFPWYRVHLQIWGETPSRVSWLCLWIW